MEEQEDEIKKLNEVSLGSNTVGIVYCGLQIHALSGIRTTARCSKTMNRYYRHLSCMDKRT